MTLSSSLAGPMHDDTSVSGSSAGKKRASERITFRADSAFKNALDRAATLSKQDMSDFARQAIEREIERVLSEHMTTTLANADFDALMDMMDDAIPVSPKMREAAERVDSGRKDIDELRAALKKPRQG